MTPDGVRYLAAASRPVAHPFHLRWLLPRLLGENVARWTWTTRVSVVACAPLLAWFTGSPWMAAAVFLPGLVFAWRHPVTVDAPGLALALLAACLWPVSPVAAMVVVLIGACVRETVPVWVACFAWSLWPLLALLAVLVRWGMRHGEDPCGYGHLLAHPVQSSRQFHRGQWLNPLVMVAPWGPLLLGLGALTPQLAVALALGYGQLVVATDSVRLYQWSAPVLALACVAVVPPVWLPLFAVVLVFNPWKGDGL